MLDKRFIRLNLCCGDDVLPGWTNVDFRATHPSVVITDLSVFPWPFVDGSADEIMLLDALEHFPYSTTERILIECFRILRYDGILTLQVPDAEILSCAIGQIGRYQCNACGAWMLGDDLACPKCKQPIDQITEAAVRRMFGGQNYPGNFHHVAFTQRSLRLKLSNCGFHSFELLEKDHQAANWNFKISAKRGDVW